MKGSAPQVAATLPEEPAGPTPEDMEARAASTEEWYRNFQRFESEITSERDTALQRIDQQVAYGTLAESAGDAARSAIEQDYTTRTEELRTGPTYQLLQEEFTAQREYALQALEPAAGPYHTPMDAYQATYRDPNAPASAGSTPEQQQAAFPYASPEEFFSARFGAGEAREAGAPVDELRANRKQAGGAGKAEGIGVGQVYNWY